MIILIITRRFFLVLRPEHNVGLLLRDRIEPQKPDIEWEMMRTVKRALDPQNLFNPGKLIPPVG